MNARWPRIRRHATAGILVVCGVCCFLTRPIWAITREEIQANAAPWAETSITVKTANVYPANTHCYTDNDPNGYGPKRQPGSYVGIVYSYGNKHLATAVQPFLDLGRGAGSSIVLYHSNSTCVHDWITGMDCSGLVARSWGYTSVNNLGVDQLRGKAKLRTAAFLKTGDAFARNGHIQLFINPLPAPQPGPIVLEQCLGGASPDGNCQFTYTTYADQATEGYKGYVSDNIQGDPISRLVVFSVGPESGAPRIKWETLSETGTAYYFVCYSESRDGPFLPVSPPIQPVGTPTTGARYEFVDTNRAGGIGYYRLLEYEISGCPLWYPVASRRDWEGQQQWGEAHR